VPDPKGAGLHAASLSAVAFRNGSWPLPTAVVEPERTRVEARRPLITLWFEVRVLGASAAVVNILVALWLTVDALDNRRPFVGYDLCGFFIEACRRESGRAPLRLSQRS
jgi:hypothetical protein